MRKLLDLDPLTGERTVFESDGDKFRVVQEHDISSIIEGNKKLAANEGLSKRGIKNDMWHYATIPNVVSMKWKQEMGVDIFDPSHRQKMFSLLNDPEYSYLKTTTLKHGG